jgi:hypothetical protein
MGQAWIVIVLPHDEMSDTCPTVEAGALVFLPRRSSCGAWKLRAHEMLLTPGSSHFWKFKWVP